MHRPRTLGELKASGYQPVSVKEEMRRNLIRMLRERETLFPGIYGYEETVIPEICNAILSKHDMLLLGLRGQAKTRIIRMLTRFLDDYIPVLAGTPTNDNPFAPISREGKDLIEQYGDEAPIAWLSREERYQEKLATPDVTVADLIGEIDLIKHAEGKYLSDERIIHYGLIPRSHRGIFAINELPDLSPKIQVALFNVLEERDVQIRGFPVRLPLDICLVFTANPEDYTNRGRIVTPLKDRIGSVIRTHYPRDRQTGMAIIESEASTSRGDVPVYIPDYIKAVVEETARLARQSPAINQLSGVSVRFSIAGLENVVSNAERRALLLSEPVAVPRVSDLTYMLASGRGKIELVLSEDETHEDRVLQKLIGEAVKNVFAEHFDLKSLRAVVEWFESGHTFLIGDMLPSRNYWEQLERIPVLRKEVVHQLSTYADKVSSQYRDALAASIVEWLLEGLYVHNKISKAVKEGHVTYRR
ncbi:MAG: sigma 54-interacting transcriptional regulator [Gemmatales bacterium]|nr:AAA family ATPase [Gemmatales bacterium]MDW7994350.1 sigma 54-interacting transcriptional regulator [Gemmatales bacterium]